MITSRTVFVVGAGASAEVGLPTGAALKNDIASALHFNFEYNRFISGDSEMFRALQRSCAESYGRSFDINRLQVLINAARAITRAIDYTVSIDNLIDQHRHDTDIARVGKIAIAHTILNAERRSALFIDQTQSAPTFSSTSQVIKSWLQRLVQLLTTGVARDELREVFSRVAFIVFNYDRCIEHFLPIALRRVYGISVNESTEIMQEALIVHPYGTIGPLSWQAPDGEGVPFGQEGGQRVIELYGKGLSTFTETVEDNETMKHMRNALEFADRIVFLGFGYYEQNMRLLRTKAPQVHKSVLGTAFGVSSPDLRTITELVHITFDGAVGAADFIDAKCAALFDEYGRTLAS